jgi:hypothetical protein
MMAAYLMFAHLVLCTAGVEHALLRDPLNHRSVHVFSVATSGLKDARVRGFASSAEVWGVTFIPVGTDMVWKGFNWLAKQFARVTGALPPRQLVVTMDSTDAFVQASDASIRSAFERVSRGRPIVMGVETNCPAGRCTAAPVTAGELSMAEQFVGIPGLKYVNGGMVRVLREDREVASKWKSSE